MSLINRTAYPIVHCDSYEKYIDGECDKNEKTYLGVDIDKR